MRVRNIPCLPTNYGGRQGANVEYLVIHYTAGDGDTAEENGLYFSRTHVGASAHWFVDEQGVVASVPEEAAAWHCGAKTYVHPRCRNANSIGIELCSRKTDGIYRFAPQTVKNAVKLVRQLMKTYDIPADRVLRHYDVTGKACPAPFLAQEVWENFLEELMEERYDDLQTVPAWGQPTVEKLTGRGFLQGDGTSLNLSRDMLRLLVILDRAGVFAP